MSTYAAPPKLRSFVDHKPKMPGDMFVPRRVPRTYNDHYPITGDIRTTRLYINSYVDHSAHTGDLTQM